MPPTPRRCTAGSRSPAGLRRNSLMKGLPYFLWLGLGAIVAMAGDNPVPVSLPRGRYAEMSARSPFAAATAAPMQQTVQSFAAHWYVSGMARLNGEDLVSIK